MYVISFSWNKWPFGVGPTRCQQEPSWSYEYNKRNCEHVLNWCVYLKKWVFVYRHWCQENEMVFGSHEVPFPAMSDQRSQAAGNGTECEVKTIELSSSTSGGEQWAFLNFHNFTAVKKTVPKLWKWTFFHFETHWVDEMWMIVRKIAFFLPGKFLPVLNLRHMFWKL